MEERGRQPERTALSWFRTVLGFVAVGILALRQANSTATEVVALAVIVPILVGVSVVATLRTRQLRTRWAADTAGLDAPPWSAALLMTLGVLAVGLLALALAV